MEKIKLLIGIWILILLAPVTAFNISDTDVEMETAQVSAAQNISAGGIAIDVFGKKYIMFNSIPAVIEVISTSVSFSLIFAPLAMGFIFLKSTHMLGRESSGLAPLRILLFFGALFIPLVSLSSAISVVDLNEEKMTSETYNATINKMNSAFAVSTRTVYVTLAYFFFFMFYLFATYFVRRQKELRGGT